MGRGIGLTQSNAGGGVRHPERIRLGVSVCLLSESVRYDGGHKKDAFLTEVLGNYVEWVPVCPEIDIGLGVPRDTLRLVGRPESPRLVQEASGEDLTERMRPTPASARTSSRPDGGSAWCASTRRFTSTRIPGS